MEKIFVISDVHVNSRATVHGREFLDDTAKNIVHERTMNALRYVLWIAREAGGVFVSAGDLFESHRPRSADLTAVIHELLGANRFATLLLAGNHELPDTGAGPLDILEQVGLSLSYSRMPALFHSNGYGMVMLPYQKVPGPDPALIQGMIEECHLKNIPCGLIFHGTIEGAGFLGTQEWEIPRSFISQFDFAAGGHLHNLGAPYCGSLVRRSHGEEEITPSVTEITIDKGRAKIERRPIPEEHGFVFRTIRFEHSESLSPGGRMNLAMACADAHFVRLITPEWMEEREAMEIKRRLLAAGVMSVKRERPKVERKVARLSQDVAQKKMTDIETVREAVTAMGESVPAWLDECFRELEEGNETE